MALPRELTDEQIDVLAILEAMITDSVRMADATHDFLRSWSRSLNLNRDLQFPAEFLLELSAVLRIESWQRCGLAKELEAEFPSVDKLLCQLIERLMNNPQSFCSDPNSCSAPLSREVMRIWFEKCSWTGPELLGAEIAVEKRHPDLQIDLLAELLWSCRHLKQKGSSNACTDEE